MYINNDLNYIDFLSDKEVFIYGAGIDGKRVCTALLNAGIRIMAFVVSEDTEESNWNGIGIISFESFIKKITAKSFVVIASSDYVGEIKNNLLNNGIFAFVDADCIDYGGDGALHYGRSYFEQQIKLNVMFADYKALFFKDYIEEDMSIVEFGCSGGELINKFKARKKLGVEINDVAREYCEEHGLECVKTLEEIPDEAVDLIFSADVLEHVTTPFEVLKTTFSKLRKGGKAIFLVPGEYSGADYHKHDNENHLYSWNALTLGNLFKTAGFLVRKVETIPHGVPRDFRSSVNIHNAYELAETLELYGALSGDNYIFIVAEK